MSMFNDISWGCKDNEKECELSAQPVSIFAKKFSPGRWSFLGPGSEKKWSSTHEYKPQGEWDRVAEQMMIKFSESGHPVFRSTSPLSRGTLKSKGGGKLSTHFCAYGETIETVLRTIISVNQLSIYGALRFVWRIQILPCKNRETCFGETIWPIVCAAKFVDENTNTFDLLPKYQERVERLSQQNRMIKFCTGAGLLTMVDVGQYFMNRHWRMLTIYRVSGLSWVHFAKRWKIIWPERLGSREYQTWARTGSHNQLPTR